ncbi:hypothetical protein Avbf_05327 [Armadillidium vulgare]|nr:hypothetical protein Avbf_05327 [Armadillidium vulgare]
MRFLLTLASVCVALCFAETCPNGQGCESKSGDVGCCPYKDAVCCSDKKSCCPKGTTCDTEKGTCKGNFLPVPFKWMLPLSDPEVYAAGVLEHQHAEDEKIEKDVSEVSEDEKTEKDESGILFASDYFTVESPVESVRDAPSPNGPIICPDNYTVCEPYKTCCPASRIGNSTYGCCEVYQGVCCDDYMLGCCDHGTVCTPDGCSAQISLGFGFRRNILVSRRRSLN